MENRTFHYKRGLRKSFNNGGITCPFCSDIQNPKGQSKFIMVKIEDFKIECEACGTIIILDR